VLVVEDDELVRRATVRMVTSLGYTVLAPEDTGEALRLAGDRSVRLDLLLSDVVMPGMKGPELRARIEQLRPGLPAIFMSGHPADAVLAAGVAEGRIRFLQKPFSRVDLAEKLHEALG
jgi:CheY-like chemotaxis protein